MSYHAPYLTAASVIEISLHIKCSYVSPIKASVCYLCSRSWSTKYITSKAINIIESLLRFVYIRISHRFEISPQSELNSACGHSPYGVYSEKAIFPTLKTPCEREIVSEWCQMQCLGFVIHIGLLLYLVLIA